MAITYLKKAVRTASTDEADVRAKVEALLAEIESGGEEVATRLCRELDGWQGEIVVTQAAWDSVDKLVSPQLKDDIQLAHRHVKRFAEAQRGAIQDVELEMMPGLVVGHRNLPLETAGCYVPGGRYAHIASAIMTVTTAKAAGVGTVVACSPPRSAGGIHPAQLYALKVCGADRVLNLGGVQAIGAMAFGLFGCPKADILCGPGNQFVAEAKRLLYGRVAIDMFAGPTETLVIADATADPDIVAADLVGQAEHGYNSPVWLISLDEHLAREVMDRAPRLIAELPEPNRVSAEAAWRDYAEVALVESREEAATLSDRYASEHLHVQCADLGWWHDRLRNYGSLFLGEETTVAFGDKISGPNHVLPTKSAARYTGGLSVGKFMKTVTWQRMSREANRIIAPACARISRHEGMEAHARSADVRLAKWFREENFDLFGTE